MLYRRKTWDCIFLIVGYLSCLCLLWKFAGQQLFDFPSFIISMKDVILGYSDAMSLFGSKLEILIYLLVSLLILVLVWASFTKSKTRLFIITGIVITLFFGFKAAFIRHDGHAMIGVSVLLGVCFLLYMFRGGVSVFLSLLLAMVIYIGVVEHYTKTPTFVLGKDFVSRIVRLPEDSANLLFNHKALERRYEIALENIRRMHSLPDITGNVDIISFRQSILIAGGLRYRPRPIIQSYSAYTPELMEKNANFLRGPRAPENIFFSVEPIDGRLAALEDSRLWLMLIDRYEFISLKGDIAYFRHRPPSTTAGLFKESFSIVTAKLGEKILLPTIQLPLWVEIEIQPTWLGYVGNIFFKLPSLEIVITTLDGASHSYRYIASMGKGGFLVSPLIENLDDFIALVKDNSGCKESRVESIQINEISGCPNMWRRPEMSLRYYRLTAPGYLSKKQFNIKTRLENKNI
jgi:hypothetical protein